MTLPRQQASIAVRLGTARGPAWMHALAAVIGCLPYAALRALGGAVGVVVYALIGIRRRHTVTSLRASGFADAWRLALGVYASLGTALFELLWVAGGPDERLDHCVELGPDVDAAFAQAERHGRGVVIATAHTGNWDLTACAAARWQARRGGPPLCVVTKRLSWRALDRFWQELRARRGISLVEASGAVAGVRAALAAGAPVALLVDQAPERASGVARFPFLGRQALHDLAPVTIAARAGAPIVVVFGRRGADGRHVVEIADVIDPAALRDRERAARRVAAALERFVRAYPAQWLWLHRRWKPLDGRGCRPRPGSASVASNAAGGPQAATAPEHGSPLPVRRGAGVKSASARRASRARLTRQRRRWLDGSPPPGHESRLVHRSISPRVAAIRAAYLASSAELERCIPLPDRPIPVEQCGLALGRRRAALLDTLLEQLFETTVGGASGIALAGVGGYGRGAVALRSDVDVRLLSKNTRSEGETADALLYPLWDMGVAVGHQVVTIDDLLLAARDDLPSATTLLDWRHVAGDETMSARLRDKSEIGLFAHSELPRFMERLSQEIAQRHERFGGSVYLLEPDVKNGAGGLRDLDVLRWAAKARYRVGELDDLVRVGALVPREALEIQAASEMLWRVRNLLHAHAGRRSDRLTFDEQESCAALLGYGEGGEAVERMMSDYYRNARAITRALDTMLARATPILTRRRPRDEDLGAGVRAFDGNITLAETDALRTDPALALRLVAAAVERDAPLLAYARDAIHRVSAEPTWCEHLRESAEAAQLFRALVATRKETRLHAGSALRELHDLGLLLAMIPEFLPVVGRVHHDVYHVYTVDVHSVAAVDRLAELARGDVALPRAEQAPGLGADFSLAYRLAAEIARPQMLFFATLLHDVGKAIGGKDHSQRGAEMARAILSRLGFAAADVDEACHLVRKHLVMYHVATRRDLDDPASIEEFSREVNGRETLRDLYLLTVADLSTTSPTSMTSWKARMLDELYLATDIALSKSSGAIERDLGVDDRIATAREEVLRAIELLPASGDDEARTRLEFARRFLASMPERYALTNAPFAVAAHAELARRHGAEPVSVALVPSRHPEAAEICVVAADRPGLLAAITAAITASRLEVHAAQIHSHALPDGQVQAVDLFWVRDRGEGAQGVHRALPKLRRDLLALVRGEIDAHALVESRVQTNRDRASPPVRTEVRIDDRASPTHTVIEVLTRDRPGLLFTISDCLYRLGLSIAVAKINTEGTRVADVFYVTESAGGKVTPGPRTADVAARIRSVVEGLEAQAEARR